MLPINSPKRAPEAIAHQLLYLFIWMSILEHNMKLHIRFWKEELPIRVRRWWHQHWWPSRIEQVDKERLYWRGKFYPPEDGTEEIEFEPDIDYPPWRLGQSDPMEDASLSHGYGTKSHPMSKTRTVTIYHVGTGRPYTVVRDVVRMSGFSGESLGLTVENGNKYTFILRNTVSVEEVWKEVENEDT